MIPTTNSAVGEAISTTSNQSDAVLVVDLDGTLTPTDTLVESALVLLRESPLNLIRMLVWLFKGRAALKQEIASRARLQVELLPYREEFLDYVRRERETGRRVVLATAAHRRIADAVAEHLQLFDEVLATEGDRNLKGSAKLAAIEERFGDRFVYAGDSRADLPIWKQSQQAILVGASAGVSNIVKGSTSIEAEFVGGSANLKTWIRALRVHQWLKNVLLFIPLMTAFSFFQFHNVALLTLAFFSFSTLASATYMLNDLWDLNSDRAHPRKKKRPFAAGAISPLKGVAVASGLFVLALGMASLVSNAFLIALLSYLVLTTSYSLVLKSYVLIDVLMLSTLYTLRIIAGALAVDVTVSNWLLAFSAFIFLSLALVKRCAELVSLAESGKEYSRGRDYRVSDLSVLWPLGVGASTASVVVFGLFISSPETLARYETPHLLWLLALGLVYWLGRLWIKTSRGQMDDDPVVYAIKDRSSLLVLIAMLLCMMLARFQAIPIPFLDES